MNELVHAINKELDMKGDEFIRITNNQAGITFRLNVAGLRKRLGKKSGGGGGSTSGERLAYCAEDAPSGDEIQCYLDSNDIESAGAGTEVTVVCNISNGDDLDEAMPLLSNDDPIIVTSIGGVWYSTTQFNGAKFRT